MLSYLLKVLNVVLGGSKNHRLFLRLRYVPQEVEQQCRLVVHTQVEECKLRGNGRIEKVG